jgi:rfaE bifunctional protein nucleotidyltransferase chain/domain
MTARIILDYRQLAPVLQREREKGRTIAAANGCFDLLHVGHVRMIAGARREADVLVVALNTDETVRAQKGAGRPRIPLAERVEIVAALEGVDYVTSFPEATADSLLATLLPDVQVKGTDWTPETVPEGETVRSYGGRVAICGDPKKHSSSDLARRRG